MRFQISFNRSWNNRYFLLELNFLHVYVMLLFREFDELLRTGEVGRFLFQS